MPTPEDEPRTVTQVRPPRDGTTPSFEPPSETVAATPAQQLASAELSTKKRIDLIADRYLLAEEIGRGGMGVVHYAKDIHLNREVAVKLLLDRYPADSVVAARFVEEAKITAQLQHPGVAPVHDLGTMPNGRPFLAMKLIKGKTLSKLLANSEHLTPQPHSLRGKGEPDFSPFPSGKGEGGLGGSFLDTFSEICQTVAFAHSKGVVHRDLKPANVMVGAFGEVQVMDWGLAKVLRNADFGMRNEQGKTEEKQEPRSLIESDRTPDSETLAGSVMGTPAYMPPEQAKGEIENTTARSDVFALGAILCELLTGLPPYTGSFEEIRAHSILGDIQPALARLNASGADADLVALATACLTPDPAGRPADAGEVVSRLTAYRTGVADRLRVAENDRAAAEVREHERIKRRRVWLALAALMVIGTATSVVFAVKSYFATEFAKGETLRANIESDRVKERIKETQEAHAETQKQKARAEKQLNRAEWLVYANSIDDAQRHWTGQRADLAFAELNACRTDFRGWEHDYTFTQTVSASLPVGSHEKTVTCVAVSPDGRTVASGGEDKLVRVWDAVTGVRRLDLRGHTHFVTGVAFTPDGRRLVSGGLDQTVRVWDLATGRADSVWTGHTHQVTGVAVSPDGRTVYSSSFDKTVRARNLADGRTTAEFKGHDSFVTCVAVAPDGRVAASGEVEKTIHLWDTTSGRQLATLVGHDSRIKCVAFSPDGRSIASGGDDGSVRVWDAATGRFRVTLSGHAKAVTGLAFQSDGVRLVSGSWDKSVRVWDVTTGNCVATSYGHTGAVNAVAVTPDGRRVLSGGEDRIVRWGDASRPLPATPYSGHRGAIRCVAVSPDGSMFLSAGDDRTVRVWDGCSGLLRTVLRGHTGAVRALVLAADGRTATTGGDDHTVRVWDLATGQCLRTWAAHSGGVRAVALSPDGRWVVTGGVDESVKVWDRATGRIYAEGKGHTGPLTTLAVSSDGRTVVSGSLDETVRTWHLPSARAITEWKGHGNAVLGVAISADGTRIASASMDTSVLVRNASTGLVVSELKGHTQMAAGVAFTPDGRRVWSWGADQTALVWDPESGQRLASLRDFVGGTFPAVAIAASGHVAIGSNGAIFNAVRSEFPQPQTELTSRHSDPMFLAVSPNGDRLWARNKRKDKSAFQIATGQPAPDDEPIPDFEGKTEVFSPDGKYSARIVNGKVQLRDEAKWARFDAEMKRRLKEWSQPNPAWHLKRADECAKDKNDFAERFHLRWVVKQVPTDLASAVRLAAVEARMQIIK